MMFMGVFWIALIVLAGMWFVNGSQGKGMIGGQNRNDEPMRILHERYARGEIDDETFRRMKRELER